MSSDKKRSLEEISPEDENPAKKPKLEEASTGTIVDTTPITVDATTTIPANNNNTDQSNRNAGNDDDEEEIDALTGKKIPKKRVALLVGYLGANFQGLQK